MNTTKQIILSRGDHGDLPQVHHRPVAVKTSGGYVSPSVNCGLSIAVYAAFYMVLHRPRLKSIYMYIIYWNLEYFYLVFTCTQHWDFQMACRWLHEQLERQDDSGGDGGGHPDWAPRPHQQRSVHHHHPGDRWNWPNIWRRSHLFWFDHPQCSRYLYHPDFVCQVQKWHW